MWFKLKLAGRDGATDLLRYNPHTSELLRGDQPILPQSSEGKDWALAPKASPGTPLGKDRAPRRLKIQMGLSCNYACSYCSQAFQISDATVSRLSDVEAFLIQLDGWIEGAPDQIELWGGEPFVYWAKIKRLLPALHARFPDAEFSIITNGSLLDREKLDFIARYDIAITVSHDGPGQEQRGPDPLADPQKRRWIEALVTERPGMVAINSVLTRDHHDLEALQSWFVDELGSDVQLGLEGVVNTYDAATLLGSGRFEATELQQLSNSMFIALANNADAFGMGERINEFLLGVQQGRPVSALGQKCGMDRPEDIAVDLRGNVMTCQNTGAKGVHKIGHVEDFGTIALDTSTHFSFRDACMTCPVVQLCKGSCMFLEGDFFEQSCKNEFAFNMGILMGAIYHLTGMALVEVEAP